MFNPDFRSFLTIVQDPFVSYITIQIFSLDKASCAAVIISWMGNAFFCKTWRAGGVVGSTVFPGGLEKLV